MVRADAGGSDIKLVRMSGGPAGYQTGILIGGQEFKIRKCVLIMQPDHVNRLQLEIIPDKVSVECLAKVGVKSVCPHCGQEMKGKDPSQLRIKLPKLKESGYGD